MGVMAQTQQTRNLPWRAIVVLAILGLLLAASVAVIGSMRPQPLPAPFGPAANGDIIFSTSAGDIVRVDEATGELTTLIDDDGLAIGPWFTNDGTKFAYERADTPLTTLRAIYVADADGSNVHEIQAPATTLRWFEFSPDGQTLYLMTKTGDRVTGRLRWDRYK